MTKTIRERTFHKGKARIHRTVKKHKKSFLKANATAIAATAVDFGTLVFLTEVLHLFYVWSVAAGAVLGAITNFTLNRHWTFDHEKCHWGAQALRYFVVSLGSLVLNMCLVYLVTETAHLPYFVSKIITAQFVGWFWNYPLQHRFVYRAN